MVKIWRFLFTLTNPSRDMLLGFSLDKADALNSEGETMTSVDIFSIGLFFIRMDFFFNEFMDEEAIKREFE